MIMFNVNLQGCTFAPDTVSVACLVGFFGWLSIISVLLVLGFCFFFWQEEYERDEHKKEPTPKKYFNFSSFQAQNTQLQGWVVFWNRGVFFESGFSSCGEILKFWISKGMI